MQGKCERREKKQQPVCNARFGAFSQNALLLLMVKRAAIQSGKNRKLCFQSKKAKLPQRSKKDFVRTVSVKKSEKSWRMHLYPFNVATVLTENASQRGCVNSDANNTNREERAEKRRTTIQRMRISRKRLVLQRERGARENV